MMFWLMLSHFVFAEEVLLRITLDDTEQKSLRKPRVSIAGKEIAMVDDGSISGDTAGDRIWTTSVFVEGKETVPLRVLSGRRRNGVVNIPPSAESVRDIALRFKGKQLRIVEASPDRIWSKAAVVKTESSALPNVTTSMEGMSTFRVVLDDARLKTLKNPKVRLASGKTYELKDDGSSAADIASDNIWVASIAMPMKERIQYKLEDGVLGLGIVETRMPSVKASTVTIYRHAGGLSSLKKEKPKTKPKPPFSVSATPVVGPSPSGKDGTALIRLYFMIDLREKGSAVRPKVAYAERTETLLDDGTLQFDTANDGIYCGILDVKDGEFASIELFDSKTSLGKATVFLPEAGQAKVRIRYKDGLAVWKDIEGDLPFVAEALAKKGSSFLAPNAAEQRLLFRINTDLANPKLRLHLGKKTIGLYTLEKKSAQVIGADITLPVYEGIQFTVLEGLQEKGSGWIALSDAAESIVFLSYDRSGLRIPPKFSMEGVLYKQFEPLALRPKGNSDSPFDGTVRLTVSLEDPLKTFQSPVIKGVGDVELSTESQGVFSGSTEFKHRDLAVLELWQGRERYALMVTFVPKASQANIALTNTRAGIQVKSTLSTEKESLVVKASAKGKKVATDKIGVQLFIDDRVLQKLEDPKLRLAQDGTSSIVLRDDGEELDKKAKDRIYSASFVVSRAEYMQLSLENKGETFGQITVFLPSSSEAKIRIRTVDEKNGLKLLTEAQAQGEVDDPTVTNTETGEESTGNLAHILWIGIVFFSILFAYIRSVVYRAWTQEVRPILERLEKFLEENDH